MKIRRWSALIALAAGVAACAVAPQEKGGEDLTGPYEVVPWNKINSPYYVAMTKDGQVAVSDGVTQKILKYDLNGRMLNGWGSFGPYAGGLWGVHQMSVDSEGNLYVAEVFNGRVQKFRPREGADCRQLIGPIVHSLSR